MSSGDLPEDRLATTAADGSRVYLHPAEVRGNLRRLRNRVYDVLLIVFLLLPWARIQGQPLLLLDIPQRKFHILGLTFWGHDAPLIFLVIVSFVVLIGLVTALFGRAWCGWACPQTVFIDRVFLCVERWIDGDATARRRLDAAPWTASKLTKRIVKWTLFLGASLVITHSFLAYFTGTEALRHWVTRPPSEHPAAFLVIVITTAIVLFNFGWFREQFCVIACPYGRLQSVLMDEHSVVVAYDSKRGEPRHRREGVATPAPAGDCVNCYRCVQVCPTGIDIRRGVQMECIGCTACIDACDAVMEKLHKPKGLIRYATEAGMEGRRVRFLRPRVWIYGAALLLALSVLVFTVSRREPIRVGLVRSAEDPFQRVHEGRAAINHFKVNLHNQSSEALVIGFELDPEEKSRGISCVTPLTAFTVAPGSSLRTDLFVTFPVDLHGSGSPETRLLVVGKAGDRVVYHGVQTVPLVSPGGDKS